MFDGHWFAAKDNDPRVVALYRRHYSVKNTRANWLSYGIVPCGERMVLLTQDCAALFIWRDRREQAIRFVARNGYDDGQRGLMCSIFRNEGPVLSSVLVEEACQLAWRRWPGERLFTYVWDSKVRSVNPGYCFKRAGWKACGRNADGRLTILERLPEPVEVAA
jgi:hypothetical protein